MPSTSKKQSNFMAAVAHNPAFAKKVGVAQSVGKDFNTADKGKTFREGGAMKDMKMDKAAAAKAGMSRKAFEGTPADEKMDKAGAAKMAKKPPFGRKR